MQGIVHFHLIVSSLIGQGHIETEHKNRGKKTERDIKLDEEEKSLDYSLCRNVGHGRDYLQSLPKINYYLLICCLFVIIVCILSRLFFFPNNRPIDQPS